MRTNYREVTKLIIDQVDTLERSVEVRMPRKDLIAFIAAIGIGSRMPLPTSPVEHAGSWYVNNVIPVAEPIADKVNEYCVFSLDMFFDKLKTVWMNRYRVLHEPTSRAAFYTAFSWALEARLVSSIFNHDDGNMALRSIIHTLSGVAATQYDNG